MACRLRARIQDGRTGIEPSTGAPNASAPNAAPAAQRGAGREGTARNGQGDPSSPMPAGEIPAGPRARTRPGLVFVAANGTYEPRMVRLGVSNFDYTEVVSGLQEGERVALLAAAAMQQRRQEQTDRFRGMTGGGVPGMQRQGAGQPGGAGGAGGGAPRGGAQRP